MDICTPRQAIRIQKNGYESPATGEGGVPWLSEEILDDGSLGAGPDPAAHFLAALEEDERRHRKNSQRSGRVLGFVHVTLHDLDLALHLSGDFVDDRRQHLAGSAPGCMEIHED